MPVQKRHVLSVLLLAMLPAFTCEAAGYTYRWTDADGNLQYSDTMPSGVAERGYEVIDPATGAVVREIAPRKTEAEKAREAAEREAAEKARRAAEEQARQDRVLQALYSSVADIERVRDQRLKRFDARIDELTESIERLQQRLSEGRGNRTDALDIRKLSESRERLRYERREIEVKFEKEIERFLELQEDQ